MNISQYDTQPTLKLIRHHYKEMCAIDDWINPVAVTLTLKYCYYYRGRRIWRNQSDYEATLKHFLNVLNKKIYGRGWKKFGCRLSVIFFYEEQTDVARRVRPHFHGCIDRPPTISEDEFQVLIETTWSNLNFGYQQVRIDNCNNRDGWLNYISKFRTKMAFADALDVQSFHNPTWLRRANVSQSTRSAEALV
jgi:hypothetical protein